MEYNHMNIADYKNQIDILTSKLLEQYLDMEKKLLYKDKECKYYSLLEIYFY